MKARAEALLPGRRCKTWISTFHAFCVRLLRREAAAAGLKPGFLIYDTDDQLADRARGHALPRPLGEAPPPAPPALAHLRAQERGTRSDEDDEGSFASRPSPGGPERYRESLEAAGALDFDDLLLRACRCSRATRGCATRWQRALPLPARRRVPGHEPGAVRARAPPRGPGRQRDGGGGRGPVDLLAGAGPRSRTSSTSSTTSRARACCASRRTTAPPRRILDAASALVAHNERRKGKTLRAVKPPGDCPCRLYEAADEFDEATSAVTGDRGARAGAGGRALPHERPEPAVRGGAPPAAHALRRGGGRRLLRAQGGEGRARLPAARGRTPRRRGLPADRERARPAASGRRRWRRSTAGRRRARGAPLGGDCATSSTRPPCPSRATQPLARFRETARTRCATTPCGSTASGLLIERILAGSGYSAMLAREDTQESQDRLENLAELLSAAADYESERGVAHPHRLPRPGRAPHRADQVEGDAPVVLMTLHAAKGLEFDRSSSWASRRGCVPHSRSLGWRGVSRGGAAALLRGDDPGHGAALLSWAREPAGLRPASPLRAQPVPGRDPAESASWAQAAAAFAALQAARRPARATSPNGRDPPGEPGRTPASSPAPRRRVRPGVRVRHPLFGVGTVLRSEGDGDELKVTVSFAGVGAKKLVARYAGLEVV